jgi:hypothetical protein
MDAKTLTELEERVKALESVHVEIKAGSKFGKESREAIGKVAEALLAGHKGIKACHDALMKMIEDAPVEEQSGTSGQDGGASDGREVPKPNTDAGKAAVVEAVKIIEGSSATLADALKFFETKEETK